MRLLLLAISVVTACESSSPCDQIIHDDEDTYDQDCAALDVTSPVAFDEVEVVLGQTSVFMPQPVKTPEMIADGEPFPDSYDLYIAFDQHFQMTGFETTLAEAIDGGGDGFEPVAVVVARVAGTDVATGVATLTTVDRGYDSYYDAPADLAAPPSPNIELWGDPQFPCARIRDGAHITYFVIFNDIDCDGIPDATDPEPAVFNATPP